MAQCQDRGECGCIEVGKSVNPLHNEQRIEKDPHPREFSMAGMCKLAPTVVTGSASPALTCGHTQPQWLWSSRPSSNPTAALALLNQLQEV